MLKNTFNLSKLNYDALNTNKTADTAIVTTFQGVDELYLFKVAICLGSQRRTFEKGSLVNTIARLKYFEPMLMENVQNYCGIVIQIWKEDDRVKAKFKKGEYFTEFEVLDEVKG